MELREWTQEDLSDILGITPKHLNKILQDKQPITLEMAKGLERVFGSSAQYWINLDAGYRLWLAEEKATENTQDEVNIKKIIFERMPISDMLKKGWLKQFRDVNDMEAQVLKFWSWSSLDFSRLDREYLPFLARRSDAYNNQFRASYAITWYQMARNIAKKRVEKAYKRSELKTLYDRIHTFTRKKDGINQFIDELYRVGVIFFVLPHLQKTYLDGASFLIKTNPVVVYTARYKRIDNFWFTVAHEIAHVLKHLSKRKLPFVLDNFSNPVSDSIEAEANEMAAGKLRHPEILDYLNPYLNYLTASKIKECAKDLDLHPSIIIGKLAHDELLSYRNVYLFNDNVLEHIDTRLVYWRIK
jgi:HTH-type transcriptional regulator/antitoxin HigA